MPLSAHVPDLSALEMLLTVAPAELARTPLVSREAGSGTRDALTAALARSLGPDEVQVLVALSLSTTSAIRAAVLAGAGPAVLSGLAVSDDLAVGRLVEIDVPGLDLRRSLRAVWRGSASLPPGAARDLIGHILSHSPGRRADGRRARMRLDAPAPGESSAPRLQPVGESRAQLSGGQRSQRSRSTITGA